MRRAASGNIESMAHVLQPHDSQEPILGPAVRSALMAWLEEIWAEEDLHAVGIAPRLRALFTGPPGCGKTTLAHHLAARLGIPLAVADGAQLIDSFVGSSEKNIAALFDAASRAGPFALFFDEFDSLGVKRKSATQAADNARNQWVNVLLQRMERHDGIMIAATNRPDDLDQAIWRRFDMQIELGLPAQQERERILALYLAPYVLPPQALISLGRDFNGASPALIRQFCEGLKRNLILGPKIGWDMDKAAVIERLVAAVHPHPDITAPPLWQSRSKAQSVAAMPWPLQREGEA